MADPEFLCVIDEAGCSGSRFGQGSSRYLAMGACIVRQSNLDHTMSLFEEAREERGKSGPFQKFSNCSDKDNFVLTHKLNQRPVQIAAVAFDKPALKGTHVREHHGNEYNYLLKFLIERVSWIVRDAAPGAGPKLAQIVLSEQRMYPMDATLAYLERLRRRPREHNCSAEWDCIGPISTEPHKNEEPIHLADIVASAFHRAVDPKQHDMTDERFFMNILSRVYRRNGRAYGVKIFPKDSVAVDTAQGRLRFLNDL